MNLSRPLTSLIPTLEGEVLTVLAAGEIAFTGRQIHKIIGKNSHVGVSKVLQKLVKQGIVTVQSAGASNLYQLNGEHLLVRHIVEIANLRAEFFRLICLEVNSWGLHPECVAVFGSAARSDMAFDSDIDLFISRPAAIKFGDMAWRRQLTEFTLKVGRWSGNSVNTFEVGPVELKQELGRKEGVLYSIIDQGLVLYGPPEFLRKLRSRSEVK